MDIGECNLDGKTYTAFEFSQLTPVDLAEKRRWLVCPECRGPAFFRKGSSSGQAPCFGARPHSDTCDLAAQDVQRRDGDADGCQDEFLNTGERIVVDFKFGSQPNSEYIDDIADESNRGHGGRYLGNGFGHAQMHRRLSSLLRTLIEVPAFSQSNQIIGISGFGDMEVKDFFVPILSATNQLNGMYRGFWGSLSDVGFSSDGSAWLNSSGHDGFSFILPKQFIKPISERYRIKDDEDLAGAYILVFGILRISANGKLFCSIEDTGYMALRLT